MSDTVGDIDQSSVVFLGAFDVTKMHPNEEIIQDILTPADADHLRVTFLLPRDVIEFETQFLIVHVDRTRCSIQSRPSAPVPEKVIDFAAALLPEVDVMVTAMGINRDLHFPVRDPAKYKGLRDKLINQNVLGSVLNDVLVRALIVESKRHDSDAGNIVTRVEASVLIPQGLFIQVNDHTEFLPPRPGSSFETSTIFEKWSRSVDYSTKVVDSIRGLTK
jgi:hypothetical protein